MDFRSAETDSAAMAPDQKLDAEDLASPSQFGTSGESVSARVICLFLGPGIAIPTPGTNW
jgi:hypothetical protein